ncbi:MAG: M28 family peptidase, partial [Salinivirgaceae bacterium]|nr:M28 family peptidase [Salinivirgaceae bacterium]
TFFYLGYGRQIPNIQLDDKVVVLLLDQSFGKTYETVKRISKETSARYFVVIGKKTGGFINFNPEKHTLAKSGIFQIDGLFENFSTKFLDKNSHKYDLSAEHYNAFMQYNDTLMISLAYPNRTIDLFNMSYKDLVKQEKKAEKKGIKNEITFRNDTAIVFAETKELQKDTIPTENVVAFIEGSDKKNEVIVVCAHYDHLGTFGKQIYYGADDNASGTASIMEMAGAFQQLANKGIRPHRSILFVAFSGEEIGLRGSDYFVSNCPVPIDSVVLNINLDMVGRNQDNKEKHSNTVFFLANGKQRKLLKRIAKNTGENNEALKVSLHPGFSERLMWKYSSDHYRFHRINIPTACFFTGLHPDYHTSRDTPDKINYEKLTEITKAGVVTLWQIANSKKKMTRKIEIPTKKSLIEKMMD